MASAGSNLLRKLGGLATAAAAAGSSTDMHSSFPSDAPPTGMLRSLVRLLQEESIVDVAYSYAEQVRFLPSVSFLFHSLPPSLLSPFLLLLDMWPQPRKPPQHH